MLLQSESARAVLRVQAAAMSRQPRGLRLAPTTMPRPRRVPGKTLRRCFSMPTTPARTSNRHQYWQQHPQRKHLPSSTPMADKMTPLPNTTCRRHRCHLSAGLSQRASSSTQTRFPRKKIASRSSLRQLCPCRQICSRLLRTYSRCVHHPLPKTLRICRIAREPLRSGQLLVEAVLETRLWPSWLDRTRRMCLIAPDAGPVLPLL